MSRALRLTAWSEPPELVAVPVPEPAEGEALLQVLAAGVCHSDLHVLGAPPGVLPYVPPFTLGHEVAGRVLALGPGTTGVEVGDEVLVHGPWGCGRCPACAAGADNHCAARAELTWAGVGLGRDGGMADHLVAPVRTLVPSRGLDPVEAVGLTDAGLTSYAAVEPSLPALVAGTTAVVIGVGGLGHLAVQVLRALTPARVVAVDTRELGRASAVAAGAHEVRESADGIRGAALVLDVVGSQGTVDAALRAAGPGGDVVVVGSAGGQVHLAKGTGLAQGIRVALPYWGTRRQLERVVDLAVAGSLCVEVEQHPLEHALVVLERLRAGLVRGRAVLVPGAASC